MSKLYDLLSAMCGKIKKPDWNQNDSTAADYVKNRPFYTGDPVETVLVEETTVPLSDPGYGIYMAQSQVAFEIKVGETYKVYWDGAAYECPGAFLNEANFIGNLSIGGAGSDTGEPFLIGQVASNFIIVYAKDTSDSHTFSISELVAEVVKIDKKYIPDLDLAPVAKSGDYYDLNNRPTVYNDVVRYSVSQGLTSAQQNIARQNIDAASTSAVAGVVKYTASQDLSVTQKQQARTNIGAGTSSFSGNYNDLTNKPDIVQSDWEVNDDSDMAYIKNRTHYDYTKYTQITFLNWPTASSLINDIYYYGERTGSSLGITAGDIYKVSCSNDTTYISTCKYVPILGQPIAYKGRVLGNARLGADAGYLDVTNPNYPITDTDTGEPWCFISYSHTAKIAIISTIPNFNIQGLAVQSAHELKQLDEKYIPSTIQRVEDDVIIPSSTPDSDKKFKIIVDDSGKPTFTNLSDSTDFYTSTDLPSVTTSDSGKFLRVSSTGEWVAETIPNASGVSF